MDILTPDGSASRFHPRAYQLEMLEESLEKNVIVAVSQPSATYFRLSSNKHQMDTGSGKTNMHVFLVYSVV